MLGALDVHIWRVFLPAAEPLAEILENSLSDDERAASEKLRDQRKKASFIARKAIARFLISKYTSIPASRLRFSMNQFGKPELLALQDSSSISFNISHSGEWLVIIFSQNKSVGIDIELMRQDFPVTEISNRFFTCMEKERIKSCPGNERLEIFYRMWVRKEAYVKALGKGLYMPLDSFHVPLDQLDSTERIDHEKCTFIGKIENEWLFYDLPVSKNYCSCFVTRFIPAKTRIFNLHFPEDFNGGI